MMTNLRLRTYWTANEAHIVYEFLQLLQDEIWSSYGEDITQWCRTNCQGENGEPFDDDIEF